MSVSQTTTADTQRTLNEYESLDPVSDPTLGAAIAGEWIRANPQTVAAMPTPHSGAWRAGEAFDRSDVDMSADEIANLLHEKDMIERVERDDHGVSTWRTRREVWGYVQQLGIDTGTHEVLYAAATDDGCPECGHPGFKNEPGVDGLTCHGCGTVAPKRRWR